MHDITEERCDRIFWRKHQLCVLAILFDLLNELKSKTFVIKTKKDCGYHIYWLSHMQHPAIGISKCKRGYGFEIKSDNSCTLPPSVHRDDSSFRYRSLGSDSLRLSEVWL